ncbi:OLC1v1016960C2 [Oldenlandia corymbosa var. corymbosa]|uniref:OLC1v1016960C2 n=1 Tax=Oldenlandia corymbosa var. corymbosa TaxID=529605 RepID=A0AAV1E8C3_OLDCO|nr:OLC1v1016960C2 [Oldenlandia corymbosa var. corymbosa]
MNSQFISGTDGIHNLMMNLTGLVLEQHDGSYATGTLKNRKLKEHRATGKAAPGHDELEDYRPIDPVPSSKASIRPGPIQHGTPLMPYIPKPSPPPGHSKHIGFP